MSLNIELLKESFEVAKPIAAEVAAKFYEFLFKDYPQVISMFKDTKMDGQKTELIKSLVFVIDHIDQPDKLTAYLKDMGRRHVGYGASEEHYPAVGKTLIKTFKFFFKDQWTKELNDEWTKAYDFISKTMIEGARDLDPSADLIKKRAQALAHQIVLESISESFDEEMIKHVRRKVRTVLYEVLQEESDKILKKSA